MAPLVESVARELAVAQDVLVQKYGLPRDRFVQELRRRMLAEEILDEPAVTRWQTLYGALMGWPVEHRRAVP